MTPDDALAEVTALVREGRTIDAIKRYRELTGEGLKESKDAVEQIAEGRPPRFSSEALQRMTGAPPGESLSSGQRAELERLIVEGKKIEAIKLHRQFSRTGLKEAKDEVEALEAELRRKSPLPFPGDAARRDTGRGLPAWVWFLVALGAGGLLAVFIQRA
ncbi:hypothetical protein KYC5002_19240 [Archangium violaceum]|uniref:hypothetical protein n=1 Tax=Archangium violaceum TaxID=83451 RepID=UPI002B293508|nr:hypothetical protein KYC5002_19240 [Archangium gephyra]